MSSRTWGDRLRTVAATATRREQAVATSNVKLSCAYLGVKSDTGYGAAARVRKKSTVAFNWVASNPNFEARAIVELDANNACDRGIKIPESWKSAIRFDAEKIASDSADKLKRQHQLDSCECSVLGCPKPAPLRSIEQPLGVGSCLALQHRSGARLSYLLAAHVYDDIWYAHRGSMRDVEMDDDAPFRPRDLKLVDILRDALEPGEPLSKRRCPVHARAPELREAARRRREDWELCCAYAAIKAEETRAAQQRRDMDPSIVASIFERNPFGFTNSNLFVRCKWVSQDGEQKMETFHVSLRALMTRGVPAPESMAISDMALLRRLQEVAIDETNRTKCKCKYLGVKHGGRYYPHPKDWVFLIESRTHARVHFEWEGVRQGSDGEPYRVDMRCNNILHLGRNIKGNPLSRVCASNLIFHPEFAQGVADAVRAGIVFKGIAYESERPEIVPELPLGGRDVQDEDGPRK